MALLMECPKCKTRNSMKNKICRDCDFNLGKAGGKVYWIEYRINGRRKRERVGPSKIAAENRLRTVQTQKTEEKYIDLNKNIKTSMESLRDWYIELPEIKELASYSTRKYRLKHLIRVLGLETTINQINIEKINQYRLKRTQEPSTRRSSLTAIATVNRKIAALKHMLNRAVLYGKIDSNPIAKMPMLKENNVRERVLTDEEFERLIDVAPEYLKPVLITAFYEPMRKNEIIKLTWSEIDLKGIPGFIRLSAKRTKGKKTGRVIPLHPRVRSTLQNLPSRFEGKRVFLKDGKPFEDFRDSFNSAKQKAGIEGFVFHDFRHCAITNLRKAGNDYSTIMKASGHKTMSMFFRYNLMDEEDVAKMKWKESQQHEPDKLKKKLIAMGLNPEEVKSVLNQPDENLKTDGENRKGGHL